MANYTVFESVNMGGTHYAERIFDAIAETDVENGTFGYLDGLASGESNIYTFKPGTKDGESVVVVDQPVWTEDNSRTANQRKNKFIIEAGTKFRVRVVKKNDTFGISEEGITATSREKLDVDAFLTIDATTGKLIAADATAGDASAMEAVVERKRLAGGTLVTAAHNYGYSRYIYEARVKILG